MRREAGNSTNARDRCNEGVVYGDGVVITWHEMGTWRPKYQFIVCQDNQNTH